MRGSLPLFDLVSYVLWMKDAILSWWYCDSNISKNLTWCPSFPPEFLLTSPWHNQSIKFSTESLHQWRLAVKSPWLELASHWQSCMALILVIKSTFLDVFSEVHCPSAKVKRYPGTKSQFCHWFPSSSLFLNFCSCCHGDSKEPWVIRNLMIVQMVHTWWTPTKINGYHLKWLPVLSLSRRKWSISFQGLVSY